MIKNGGLLYCILFRGRDETVEWSEQWEKGEKQIVDSITDQGLSMSYAAAVEHCRSLSRNKQTLAEDQYGIPIPYEVTDDQ